MKTNKWNTLTEDQVLGKIGGADYLKETEAVVSFDTEYLKDKVVSMQLATQTKGGFLSSKFERIKSKKIEPEFLYDSIIDMVDDPKVTDYYIYAHYNKAEFSTMNNEMLELYIAAASMYNNALEYTPTLELAKALGYKGPKSDQAYWLETHGDNYFPLKTYCDKEIIKLIKEKGEKFDDMGATTYEEYLEKEQPKRFIDVHGVNVGYVQLVHHRKHHTIHKEMIFDSLYEGVTFHWRSSKLIVDTGLKAIGEVVGLPKLYLTEQQYNQIDKFPRLEEYGLRDVHIISALINQLGREAIDNLTLSSMVKSDFQEHLDDNYEASYTELTKNSILRSDPFHYGSYFGGMNNTPNPCILNHDYCVVDMDLKSAYSIAQNRIRAIWSEEMYVNLSRYADPKEQMKKLFSKIDPLNGEAMGTVEIIELKLKKTSIYNVPTRVDTTASWRKYKKGGQLSLAWVYTLFKTRSIDWKHSKFGAVVFHTCSGPALFAPLINHYIAERAKHPKGSLWNMIFKLKRNSLYGLVSQSGKKRVSKSYVLKGDEQGPSEGIKGKFYNPMMASYITSIIQMLLQEYVYHASQNIEGFIHLNSVTDGCAYAHPKRKNNPDAVVLTTQNGYVGNAMGLKDIWEAKHISTGCINIKTRYLIFLGEELVEGASRKITLPSTIAKPNPEGKTLEEYNKELIELTQRIESTRSFLNTEKELIKGRKILGRKDITFNVNHNIDVNYTPTEIVKLNDYSVLVKGESVVDTRYFTTMKSAFNSKRNRYTIPMYGTKITDEVVEEMNNRLVEEVKTMVLYRDQQYKLYLWAKMSRMIRKANKEKIISSKASKQFLKESYAKIFKDSPIIKQRFTTAWTKATIKKGINGELPSDMKKFLSSLKKRIKRAKG